jgi:hypothetical protein
VDCILFGYEEQRIKVLLLDPVDKSVWSLLGTYVYKNESLRAAANRIVKKRLSLKDLILYQYHTFGNPGRVNGKHVKLLVENQLLGYPKLEEWVNQDYISVCYFGFVRIDEVQLKKDDLDRRLEWFPVNDLPDLFFDHAKMIEIALRLLKQGLNYLPVGKYIMPKRFTMNQLQVLYEQIIGRKLDRGNFQKKLRKLDLLERHGKLKDGRSNKAPYIYSFKKARYQELVEDGVSFY